MFSTIDEFITNMTETETLVRQWTLLCIRSAQRLGAMYQELVQETGVAT